MDSLVVIGPFRGVTGYDRHTREFVRQLHQHGIALQLVEYQGWSPPMPVDEQDPFFDSLQSEVTADTTLQFLMPSHARKYPNYRNVNYTMFEASRIPESWVESAFNQDLIIVPNQANRGIWMDSGVPESRLALCPLAIDGAFFSEKADAFLEMDVHGRALSSFSHRFLNIADLRPRKNHLGLLRSWMQSTSPDDDAVLILKTSSNQDNFNRFRQDLDKMQQSTGLYLNQAAPVVFLISQLSNIQLRMLYQSATCYISMSKGEGWDLVMMEAAASGLPLISPDHSGYSEYIRDSDCMVINSRQTPVKFEGSYCADDFIFFENAEWWEPDEESAAAYIKNVINGKEELKSPGDRLINTYSWENAGSTLVNILNERFG